MMNLRTIRTVASLTLLSAIVYLLVHTLFCLVADPDDWTPLYIAAQFCGQVVWIVLVTKRTITVYHP